MPNVLAWLTPGTLPAAEEADVLDVLDHISTGRTPAWLHPNANGVFGRRFRNFPTANGDFLPGTPGAGGYVEYDVPPPPGVLDRGPRRVVEDLATRNLYYTSTHYGDSGWPSFWRIR